MGVINLIYRAMKSKYRAINGKLVRSHVIGCHALSFSRDSKSHLSRDKIEFKNITFQSLGGIQI